MHYYCEGAGLMPLFMYRGERRDLRDQTLVIRLGRAILRAQLFSFMKLDSHRMSSLLTPSVMNVVRLIHASVYYFIVKIGQFVYSFHH